MIKPISRTQAINERLEQENKISVLNEQKHIDAIVRVNNAMENVKRDYQSKDRNSQLSAATKTLKK
jgi:hypothetical protein